MVKIIVVGSLKETYLKAGVAEYLKRLTPFDNIEIIEVKEVNQKEKLQNLKKEGEAILAKIDSSDFVITLEIEGKQCSSEELAELIESKRTYGQAKITFVIGGSNGLSDEVKHRSNFALSFSRFTFPHQLMRLILVEQIYRAFTIMNHQEYHK